MRKIRQKNLGTGVRVLLASASERRKQMLAQLGIPAEIMVPSVEEKWSAGEAPRKVAVRLALEKAETVGAGRCLVIGMDTIVVVGRKILGKPSGPGEARDMLRLLSGKMHRVITGVALLYRGQKVTAFEETKVYFRKLKPAEIEWYLKTEEPSGKAGAYAVQGSGRVLITKVEGCYYNVVGFPLNCFQQSLEKLGLTIFDLMK